MTDHDYADMIDPFVRAEVEAFKRGYGEGIASGIFYTICALIAAGLVLVSLNAHGATKRGWTYEEAYLPIRASSRAARIVICQDTGFERKWACYYKTEGK